MREIAEKGKPTETITDAYTDAYTDARVDTHAEVRTLKGIINTPFKKAMFVVQIVSYVLIVGSPVIGGAVGGLIGLKAAKIGGLVFGIFLAGEVLFYGSLAFLGKEVVLLIRDKIKARFKRRSSRIGNT